MATNNSSANYLSTTEKFEGGTPFAAPPGKLGTEVGTIGSLDGVTAGSDSSGTDLTKKQEQSTDGGCGTSFTTATEPANINVQQSLGGNLSQISTLNDQNDTQFKIITSDGKSITMAEDGSLIFTTAKREGDPLSGRFDVRSQGSTRFKIGEALLIEVENKNNIVASKDGNASSSKGFSLVVYGNVDITSRGGEINARAKNIGFYAENEVIINAGSKISLLSGAGKGQNKSSETTSGTKEAKVEYGGIIEMKSGDINLDASTVRQTSAVDYKVVSHEGATLSTQPLSNYGFQSPGSFTMEVSGDYYEKIGGLKRTDINGSTTPVTTIFPGQSDGYLINVANLKPTGSDSGSVTPNAVNITTKMGGFKFYSKQGDVDIATLSGYWGMGNKAGVVLSMDRTIKEYPNIKPGVYLKANAGPLSVIGKTTVDMYVGSVKSSGISITAATLKISNPKGIYLN